MRERAVGRLEDPRVVTEARKDAARVALFGIDRQVRREGERPLLEPLRAERFVAKRLIAVPIG
jgi:hypothetical protein